MSKPKRKPGGDPEETKAAKRRRIQESSDEESDDTAASSPSESSDSPESSENSDADASESSDSSDSSESSESSEQESDSDSDGRSNEEEKEPPEGKPKKKPAGKPKKKNTRKPISEEEARKRIQTPGVDLTGARVGETLRGFRSKAEGAEFILVGSVAIPPRLNSLELIKAYPKVWAEFSQRICVIPFFREMKTPAEREKWLLDEAKKLGYNDPDIADIGDVRLMLVSPGDSDLLSIDSELDAKKEEVEQFAPPSDSDTDSDSDSDSSSDSGAEHKGETKSGKEEKKEKKPQRGVKGGGSHPAVPPPRGQRIDYLIDRPTKAIEIRRWFPRNVGSSAQRQTLFFLRGFWKVVPRAEALVEYTGLTIHGLSGAVIRGKSTLADFGETKDSAVIMEVIENKMAVVVPRRTKDDPPFSRDNLLGAIKRMPRLSEASLKLNYQNVNFAVASGIELEELWLIWQTAFDILRQARRSFTLAYLKSLIQKLVRSRALYMKIPLYKVTAAIAKQPGMLKLAKTLEAMGKGIKAGAGDVREFILDQLTLIPRDVAIALTIREIAAHPGILVPQYSSFVSGIQAMFKRVCGVIPLEDSFVDAQRCGAHLGGTACALLAKRTRGWVPTVSHILSVIDFAMYLGREPRKFAFDTHIGKNLTRYRLYVPEVDESGAAVDDDGKKAKPQKGVGKGGAAGSKIRSKKLLDANAFTIAASPSKNPRQEVPIHIEAKDTSEASTALRQELVSALLDENKSFESDLAMARFIARRALETGAVRQIPLEAVFESIAETDFDAMFPFELPLSRSIDQHCGPADFIYYLPGAVLNRFKGPHGPQPFQFLLSAVFCRITGMNPRISTHLSVIKRLHQVVKQLTQFKDAKGVETKAPVAKGKKSKALSKGPSGKEAKETKVKKSSGRKPLKDSTAPYLNPFQEFCDAQGILSMYDYRQGVYEAEEWTRAVGHAQEVVLKRILEDAPLLEGDLPGCVRGMTSQALPAHPIDRACIESIDACEEHEVQVQAKLDSGWLAALLGAFRVKTSECKGRVLAVLSPDGSSEINVTRAAIRNKGDELTEVQKEAAVAEALKMLHTRGVEWGKSRPSPRFPDPEWKGARVFVDPETSQLLVGQESIKRSVPWDELRCITFETHEVPLDAPFARPAAEMRDVKQVDAETAWEFDVPSKGAVKRLVEDWIVTTDWQHTLRIWFGALDTELLGGVLARLSGFVEAIQMPKIGRDGGGTADGVDFIDLRVFRVIAKLTRIIPSVIQFSRSDCIAFTVYNVVLLNEVVCKILADALETRRVQRSEQEAKRLAAAEAEETDSDEEMKLEENKVTSKKKLSKAKLEEIKEAAAATKALKRRGWSKVLALPKDEPLWSWQQETYDALVKRGEAGFRREVLNILPGLGKSRAVLALEMYLATHGKLPKFLVSTCPIDAVIGWIAEAKACGFRDDEIEVLMPLKTIPAKIKKTAESFGRYVRKGPPRLNPYVLTIIIHDHLRLMQQSLYEQAADTMVCFDEIHKALEVQTQRTNTVHRWMGLLQRWIAMTGTLVIDSKVQRVCMLLRHITPWPVTTGNFLVAVLSMISKTSTLGIECKEEVLEIEFTNPVDYEHYRSLIPVTLGGTCENPSSEQRSEADRMSAAFSAQGVAQYAERWFSEHNGDGIYVVADSVAHMDAIYDELLGVSGLDAKDIFRIRNGVTINLTASTVAEFKKTGEASPISCYPYRVVIAPYYVYAGINLTHLATVVFATTKMNYAVKEQQKRRVLRGGQRRKQVSVVQILVGAHKRRIHQLKFQPAAALSNQIDSLASNVDVQSMDLED